MIIPKRAIKAFIERPLEDWSWYRDLDDDQLNRRRDRLSVDPPIWNKLQRHQKQGLLLGIRLKKVAYWYDTGTGKTLMSIALMRYFEAKGTLRRALVLVPNKVNKAEWAREIEKHTRNLSYVILDGASDKKWQDMMDPSATVVIETYGGLMRVLTELKSVKRKGKRAVNKLVRDDGRIKQLQKEFNFIVLDESGAVGTKGSLTYRILKTLMWSTDYAYELNGTPFGRDPTPLWAQMFCLDRGETLGPTLALFRAAFFREESNGFATEYIYDKSKSKLLRQMLRNRSLRCKADDADLPDTVRIIKPVRLSSDAFTVYEKALTSLRASKGRVTETKNEFMRMRQISSGFIGYTDEDDGKRAQFEFKDNPKLDTLLDLLIGIVPNYKAVVFNEFTFSGSMICRELKKEDIPHVRIFGGTKDPQAELLRFVEDDDVRVAVINSAAGGMGLNLQVAKYVVYYESHPSAKVRKQTEARVVRQHSDHNRVFVYDLVASTVERGILKFHSEGRDLLDAILNGSDML